MRIGALEFLNGRFKLKDTVKPCDDLDAWQKSIAQYLGLKEKIRRLEILMAGRKPEYIAQQARRAADKLAENFLPLPNKTSVLLVNRAHPLPNDYAAENIDGFLILSAYRSRATQAQSFRFGIGHFGRDGRRDFF